MKLTETDIDPWIKPYTTIIGERADIDTNLRFTDPAKFYLNITLPDIFEAYAIALSSFWVNDTILPHKVKIMENTDGEFPDDDYGKFSWKDFYRYKCLDFDLKKALLDQIYHKSPFTQMNNELYPGEGLMDRSHLKSFTDIVLSTHGDQEIVVFYIHLATKSWENNRLYKGKISELLSLLDEENLRLSPSLIYPVEKNWAVNTDYDLSFTTIGGSIKLIDALVRQNKNEIYKTDY
jgi:hypothetical protein